MVVLVVSLNPEITGKIESRFHAQLRRDLDDEPRNRKPAAASGRNGEIWSQRLLVSAKGSTVARAQLPMSKQPPTEQGVPGACPDSELLMVLHPTARLSSAFSSMRRTSGLP